MTNIKNKTGRKNKTNQIITWPSPTSFFTVKDLFKTHPDFKPITMRVRLKTEIENNRVKDIGVFQNGKGRPTNVYALTPLAPTVIVAAKEAGVILHSEYLTSKVADITNAQPLKQETPTTITTNVPTSVTA